MMETERADFFMKKYIVMMAVWTILLTGSVIARTYVVRFEIFASDGMEAMRIKKEMLRCFEEIVDGVDDQYYGSLITEHLMMFEQETIKAKFQEGTLVLVSDEGTNYKISGELVKEQCYLKPKGSSWLQEVFKKND